MVTHVPSESRGDERGALLNFAAAQRAAVRRATLGLSDEQAARTPSSSALSLSGLVKHVAETELNWLRLAQGKPNEQQRTQETWGDSFRLVEDETLAGALAFWDDVARQTGDFVRSAPDLDATVALPEAPWYPKDAEVSLRWVVLHLIEETARHAGHADIVRESLDGMTSFELIAQEHAS